MDFKNIWGFDIGTNSIGWSYIKLDSKDNKGEIVAAGSRILPMPQDVINNFSRGVTESSAAKRTAYRGVRRLRERFLLRRERLIKALSILGLIDGDFNPEKGDRISFDNNSNSFQFKEAYNEMMDEFRSNGYESAVPKDWTIYYLRKKALSNKLSKNELAWIIMQFNQKRGYYESAGDDELITKDDEEFVSEKIVQIEDTGEKYKDYIIFKLKLANGVEGNFFSKVKPEWEDEVKDFKLTHKTLKDGTNANKFNLVDENDWALRKKKTEIDLEVKNETVGQYIYNGLMNNPLLKIRGKYVHTIDRKFYQDELEQILKKQTEFHEIFKNEELKHKIINCLYPNNIGKQNELRKTSIRHIIVNDILFYHRDLKSQKGLLSGCKYEKRGTILNDTAKFKPIPVASKSNLYFQEFRIWKTINDLKIYKKETRDEEGKLSRNIDVSANFITNKFKEKLFEKMNSSSTISAKEILEVAQVPDIKNYSINKEKSNKIFYGNQTRAEILRIFSDDDKNKQRLESDFSFFYLIWHILYSVESKDKRRKAFSKNKFSFEKGIIEALSNMSPFKKDYSSMSEKALKNFLSIMRVGKYWNEDNISSKKKEKIQKIIDGEVDSKINDHAREKLITLNKISDFQGLQEYTASYALYGYHSEAAEKLVYTSFEDIKKLSKNELRNPIVEQVINETLMVAREMWKEFGKPDEIHVELGRDLKNSKEQRERISKRRDINTRTNDRAHAMLKELKKEYSHINPFSIGQLNLFKIYEDAILNTNELPKEHEKLIKKSDEPTISELNKYKLWLNQKYKSPYTGRFIGFSELFSPAYEIEHMIPRALYWDDSFNNKIICEKEVNKLKDKMTAYEFISKYQGTEVTINKSNGGTEIVEILNLENYEKLIKSTYNENRSKMNLALSMEIPEPPVSRQLNDTRYINRKVMELLSPIVRGEEEKAAISKNIQPVVGIITDQLKNDWGLKDVWKQLLLPRFERMNNITGTNDYLYKDENGRLVLKAETNIKRLDHRHHAMDAIVVACCTKSHVAFINSLNSKKNDRYDLIKNLKSPNKEGKVNSRCKFKLPWETFAKDVKSELEGLIVSFKTTNRVINKSTNRYRKFVKDASGNMKKTWVKQNTENHWSIRQPLHKETIFGKQILKKPKEVNLTVAIEYANEILNNNISEIIQNEIRVNENDIAKTKKSLKKNPIKINGEVVKKVEIWDYETYATNRTLLNESITKKIIEDKVYDHELKTILLKHLEHFNNDSKIAFSFEGLEKLNSNRKIPIKKIKIAESFGKKFNLGDSPSTSIKYAEAAKGTNLFFLIYRNRKTGENLISKDSSLSFDYVVNRSKQNLPLGDELEGYEWFTISPGDLVYLPISGEDVIPAKIEVERIYKMVSCSNRDCFFVPFHNASPIENKKELGPLNKQEKSIDNNIMVKKACVKLQVNRLGRLISND